MTTQIFHDLLSSSIALFDKAMPQTGLNSTIIDNVNLFKSNENIDKRSLHYEKCLLFVLTGHKQLYFNGQPHRYHAGNYVVLTTPMPLQFSQTASANEPIRMIGVAFDVPMLGELTQAMTDVQPRYFNATSNKGLLINTITPDIQLTLYRLLMALQNPMQAHVLGAAIVRELLFWVLMEDDSHALFALVQNNTHLAKVAQVIRYMSTHYAQSMDTETLAALVNVSVPTLHRIFKEVTTTSPMQYLKMMRLHKARDLLTQYPFSVAQVAQQVGYDSSSQFSREFKRLFGVSPSQVDKTHQRLK